MDKKIVLTLLDQFFKGIKVVAECLSSLFCGNVTGIRLFANELLFDHYVFLCFQGFGMAGEVTVGHPQQFLEGIEVGMLVHHQDAHDPEAYAMVKSLVNMLQYIFQTIACGRIYSTSQIRTKCGIRQSPAPRTPAHSL